ncbi:MAG: DUF4249 domain-containing protein [Bacteroidales bacterium]|jgi:hypothetical protein|nr:DUF4249 domain-containing protein [Bacteroidales bacterium]
MVKDQQHIFLTGLVARFYYRRAIIALIFVSFLSSCQREYTIETNQSQIVVEGWIENGDVARVIVTRSIPMSEMVDSSNFLKYAIRSATVIVSDESDSDTLRMTSASQYLPPFLYVGEKIIGKEDGKYKLTVKYLNKTLTAETVIPPSVPIRKVQYIRTHPTDTIGNLSVEFTDPADQQNYYQIATLLDGYDQIFVPCLYGNLNDKNFVSPDVQIQVSRGITIFPKTNFEANFNDGDLIFVRLRTMTKEGFDFWNLWQNEIINAQNAIFPANSSLKSNISGGLGIWCGYGQHTVNILAR